MSIATTNRKIKTLRTGELFAVKNKDRHWLANFKYNHIRVQFSNNDEKHLLFTDNQIARAKDRANKNPEDLPRISWLREIWYEGFIDTGIADIQDAINRNKLPAAASRYNHIRVEQEGKDIHLLFTDYDIRIALERTEKNPEDLPKVSWIENPED